MSEARATSDSLTPGNGLAAGYRPAAGVHDEMMDAAGAVRPLWKRLVGA